MTTRTTARKPSRFAVDAEEEDTTTPPWNEDDEDGAVVERKSRRRAKPVEDSDDDEDSVEADGEETVIPISVGRKQIADSRASRNDSGAYFRWAEDGETQVVKFLDTDPWAYNQHWITRQGRQSFPCIGKKCPLCDIGVKSSQRIVYTILNLSTPVPTVQTLEVTPTLEDTLATLDLDSKTGPLPRLYWALSRSKVKGRSSGGAFAKKYNYSILPVKERDLEEDYDIDVDVADKALESAEIPTPSQVLGKVGMRELQEVADEAMA